MATWVVTGANRGIGLEFARQLAKRGERVVATARNPGKAADLARIGGVRIEKLDVSSRQSIEAFAGRLGGEPVDVLVNNAGIGGPDHGVEELTREDLVDYFEVDAIGPLLLTRALLGHLRSARPPRRIVSLSSGLGSISQNDNGGWYGYRAAKAALNQYTRTLAAELGPERFICIVISPGWVKTDMGGEGATTTPADSVRGMLKVIDDLSMKDNGRFLSHTGGEVPW
jgi:NAD(P)-dependent dehydrogenase (short-subunit alcohol dehydrogenase family)